MDYGSDMYNADKGSVLEGSGGTRSLTWKKDAPRNNLAWQSGEMFSNRLIFLACAPRLKQLVRMRWRSHYLSGESFRVNMRYLPPKPIVVIPDSGQVERLYKGDETVSRGDGTGHD